MCGLGVERGEGQQHLIFALEQQQWWIDLIECSFGELRLILIA
jgi:hypothetical protein